jgi:hypothetical protein
MAGIGKGNRDKGNSSADLLTPEHPPGQVARIPCETKASMLFSQSKPGENVLKNFDTPMQNRELLLDIATLDTLASIMPQERLIALAGSYLNGLIARTGRIAALAAQDDLALLAREAHDLKSTSGSFGARRLQYLGESLETACRENDVAAAGTIAAAIAVTVPDTVEAVLRRYPEIRIEPR